MDEPGSARQPGIEELVQQVRELQRRVQVLEQKFDFAPAQRPVSIETAYPAGADLATPTLADTAALVPVLGRDLLGIAGAFLLRALAEYGVLPKPVGAAAGILYAFVWLLLAARTATDRRLVAVVHGVTSVLILSPLLWETTVRFDVLPDWIAATVLMVFTGFGFSISWRKNLEIVAWITTLAALVTASALLMATHDLAPYTVALLVIAAAVELSACLDHWLRERWIVALVVDSAVLQLTFIVTLPHGLPEGYAPISIAVTLAVQIALLAIYLASTIVRTLARGVDFRVFEIGQCIAAYLLCAGGALRVSNGHPRVVAAVAVVSLLFSAACCLLAFVFLERRGQRGRNYYVYSTFGLLLLVTGTAAVLPATVLGIVWSALAPAFVWHGRTNASRTREWHGAIYLLLAAFVSGLVGWSMASLLAGTGAQWPPTLAQLISAAAAIAGYGILRSGRPLGEAEWPVQICFLLFAAIAALSVAGLAAGALVAAAGAIGNTATFVATLRTAVLLVLSATLAWIGRRWARPELTWLVVPLMILGAYKILTQDLRQSHAMALFASLLLYGGALVLLPRIWQRRDTGWPLDQPSEGQPVDRLAS